MVDDSHVVFAYDVHSEFLTESDKKIKVRSKVGTYNDIARTVHSKNPLLTESRTTL
jgi:hypothetical protein